jgi:hypothetical protein
MKGMYIAAIVLVLILIIAGAFFFMGNNEGGLYTGPIAKLTALMAPKVTNPWVLRPKGNWFGNAAYMSILHVVPYSGAKWTKSSALAYLDSRPEIKQYVYLGYKLYISTKKHIYIGPAQGFPQIFYVRN